MSIPLIQNFSIAAGDVVEIPVLIDPSFALTLDGATIWWRAYEQEYSNPTPDTPAVVTKGTDKSPPDISVPGSPPDTFIFDLLEADTIGLLRNYYHEATVIDVDGNRSTVMVGIMTVLPTENR
jgi:hypothetical protein